MHLYANKYSHLFPFLHFMRALYIISMYRLSNITKNTVCLLNTLYSYKFSQPKQDSNFYQILGLTKEASHQQIKAKYYELAKLHHPDANQGQQIKFQQIYTAYQVLSNEEKRRQYDASFEDSFNKFKQEFENDGYGPYDPAKMNESTRKTYYNYSQPEWAKTRRGIRPQSYTSYLSEQTFSTGAQTDSQIRFYQRKKIYQKEITLKDEEQELQEEQTNKQLLKKLMEESERKHQMRIREKEKEERRKILEGLEKKWFGGFLQKLYGKLIKRGQYDKDIEEQIEHRKESDVAKQK